MMRLWIQLFRERLSEKIWTRQSRKVIWIRSTRCSWHCSCRIFFVAFLQHSQTYVYGLSCLSLKFLWRTVNSKPPTIPFSSIWKSYMWTAGEELNEGWSSQLYTQLFSGFHFATAKVAYRTFLLSGYICLILTLPGKQQRLWRNLTLK